MDIGHILSTMPPIVENIFKYLNKRELDDCSEVCELWKRVAETEKSHREDIACFFQGLFCSVHNTIHSSDTECTTDVAEDIESSLSVQFKELKMKPVFCLSFASTLLINEFERLFPSFQYPQSPQAKKMKQEDLILKRAYLKAAVHTAVQQYLPKKCRTTFCVAPGIIGHSGNSPPLEIEEGYGISGILIPYVPGLKIFNFSIDEKQCDISKLIQGETSIKCLLIFITHNESSCFNQIIQSCLLRENSKIAIGGALLDRSESHRGSVVAFCGRSVEAASIIIKPKDKQSEVEKKLKLFQETGLLNDRCFAFMFACVARGFGVYREYNVESSVFHRLYPKVPLMGVFGNGEIGVDYLPNVVGENQNQVLQIGKLKRSRKRYLHSYTTIFVLVSVKL